MSERRGWSPLTGPLRGAGYVIGIGVTIVLLATVIATVMIRIMP